VRIISNSEVTAYNECKRRHWYQYQQELQPRTYGMALTRGIIGHAALEIFYREIVEGASVDYAKKGALDVIDKAMRKSIELNPGDFDRIKMLTELSQLIEAYCEVYRTDEFQVIAVEQVYTAPVVEGIKYGMKLDLLVEMIKGPYRGDLVIYDHKFIYNFKSEEEWSIDGQLPKYIRTVNASGHYVTKGVFNQIRYRSLKSPNPDDIFRRQWMKPSADAKEGIWQEQIDASVEIANNPAAPRRTLSPLVCKNCYFLEPCRTELNGGDITTMVKVHYEPLVDRYLDWTGD